ERVLVGMRDHAGGGDGEAAGGNGQAISTATSEQQTRRQQTTRNPAREVCCDIKNAGSHTWRAQRAIHARPHFPRWSRTPAHLSLRASMGPQMICLLGAALVAAMAPRAEAQGATITLCHSAVSTTVLGFDPKSLKPVYQVRPRARRAGFHPV